ncbi:class I SAM-dependent methyltransferase [Sanguibacter hominis ATCC BAA-789]|uniref:Class I SAM-dependent methyltransferase n=1 Tax=Sanguibacter hominis ATCC BAA-789 TaxID=1312740 RepID=A0A9X5FCM1_9MICO|nr:class I SAM-dependent methyltransferase [Sanguibacter hominis]NKX93598.1 class I SAM-dependent methyltransferase [Sanguibacter hominis ATCC BAA-789]
MHFARRLGYATTILVASGAALAGGLGKLETAVTLVALALVNLCVALFLSARALAQLVRSTSRETNRHLRALQHDLDRWAGASEKLARKDSQRLAVQDLTLARLETRVEASAEFLEHSLGSVGQAPSRGVPVSRAVERHSELLDRIDRTLAMTYRRTVNLTTAVEQVPSAVLDLSQMADRVAGPGPVRWPTLGGWAATATTLHVLVAAILEADAHPTVLECGSGASSVWIASALRARGGGHLISLEHDPRFGNQTRQELRRLGLDDLVDLRIAPLAPFSDGEDMWYSTQTLTDIPELDIVLVDGPPGDAQPMSRQPAFPLLARHLRDGSLIVLDDTDRPDEQAVVKSWTTGSVDGRSLEVISRQPRSTTMQVHLP